MRTNNGDLDVRLAPELNVANSIMDDQAALAVLWARDGYWYFRDVVNMDALAEFRRPILTELQCLGVVDQHESNPLWNGESLDRFPAKTFAGYEPFPALHKSKRWVSFLETPAISSFFKRILGSQAVWAPVAELRITPPAEDLSGGVFTYPHQDGFYNEGYRCLTAWFPLWPVPRDAGGLIVAAGMHRGEYLHDLSRPPRFPIPEAALPDECWRTTDYLPGDVVIFDRKTPHSGLRNRSKNLFRVSFDVRCVLPGDPAPIVGIVKEASARAVTIISTEGQEQTFELNEKSYCRGVGSKAGERLKLSELSNIYKPGHEVMVTLENGAVRLLREPKY